LHSTPFGEAELAGAAGSTLTISSIWSMGRGRTAELRVVRATPIENRSETPSRLILKSAGIT
jgi:hypothetical protein